VRRRTANERPRKARRKERKKEMIKEGMQRTSRFIQQRVELVAWDNAT